ncbi:hypothetical protein [Nonomuraea sp. 10N515B]|uniref:hypothetical protein n=1 Tax=Nonomuraea sp. 10N515B TaxID=3457422 RepID=UPI003FCDF571
MFRHLVSTQEPGQGPGRRPDAAQRRERARVRSEKGIRWGGRPLSPAACLKLRAVQANGDLDAYFRFHLAREHERIHHTHHQDRYHLIA